MARRIREKASFEIPKTRTEAIQTQSKERPSWRMRNYRTRPQKNVDRKLVCAIQRYQKEQEENYGLDNTSPLSEEILTKTFFKKFKLSSLNKYDGMIYPRSHLAIFWIMMQLQDVNNFMLCRVFPFTLVGLAQKWYQHLSLGSIHNFK